MIFSENNNSFSLVTSLSDRGKDMYKGLWIALIGTDEIPHVALINDGAYYSLSVKKVDIETPLERLLNTVERKHLPSLFISIETNTDEATTNMQLEGIYKVFTPLGKNDDTCLSPIKDFFTIFYSAEFAGVNYVFELLALAEKKKWLIECVALYQNISSSSITLPKYTMAEIRKKIVLLSTHNNDH